MRNFWQSTLIASARSEFIKKFMQKSRATSFLREKYVAGALSEQAVAKATELRKLSNVYGSLFYMGEYVNDPDLVNKNMSAILEIANLLEKADLDVHVSVDPTQIGYQIRPENARSNAKRIASYISNFANAPGKHCLMLDMEDDSLVQPTIDLHDELKAEGLPVALTLQAYLRRTASDLESKIESGSSVRLVRGAFAAGNKSAFQSEQSIKDNYLMLIEKMFSSKARDSGFYPSIATHDTKLQDFAICMAQKNGWTTDQYEFEMLLGVRNDVASKLSLQGQKVRLYLPFGEDWWPHAARRIGENPKNAWLLLRSLFT